MRGGEAFGNENSGPLSGVRIADMTTVVMGPYATQILADLGADVIKIERPEGDVMRHIGPMRNPRMGHLFLNSNRNKRSVVLDLAKPSQKEAALRLIETADVFVHNTRPAAIERLGLGFEQVSARNGRIIYAAAVGYGSSGSYAGKPAYDDLIQGASGMATAFAVQDAGPPRYVPLTIADRTVGIYLASCICAALYARTQKSGPRFIEVPMFETFTHLVMSDHMGGHTFRPPEGAPYYARIVSRDRRPYRTADGYLSALIYNDRHWKSFSAFLSGAHRADDPRFASQQQRALHIDAFYAMVAEVMMARTTREWIDLLERADIPVAPLHSVETLLEDAHLNEAGFLETVEHPTEGTLRALRAPATWGGYAPAPRYPAPTLGEHTDEVLTELGLCADDFD